VYNIPHNFTEEELVELFSPFGETEPSIDWDRRRAVIKMVGNVPFCVLILFF
jgi:RNA recognition motif-containing protein